MNNCYENQVAANGGSVNGSGNESNILTSGSYITNKPFMEWAKWSHSWEGTGTYGFTAGKYKEGLYKDLTEQGAEEKAMSMFWKPNNIDLIKDPSVAIACMWCVFWTGNAHLLYQVAENPDVYGGRPKPLPKGHYRMSKELVDKLNQLDPYRAFTKIKKQLGWFGQLSQSSKNHYGHRNRWCTVNFHQELIKNNSGKKWYVPNQEEFLNMIEKL